MKFSSGLILGSVAAGVFLGCLFGAPQSPAQSTSTPKAAPKSAKGAATKKTETRRPALSPADVQRLWMQKDQELLLNEIRLRGLAVEPEEEWVARLPQPSDQPLAIAELRRRIPPGPEVDAVAAQAPDLLAKLRDAAQKRSEPAMEPLVHPDLMTNKVRVYDLFDTANYRSHTLGRFTSMDNRRVGVQFFQLTTSQVERLHYIVFSNYGGKLVVRDVVTGPAVAALFLHDEEQLAQSKLNLVFRALNDRDDTGLKNLCTPGLYESLKASGAGLVRGKSVSVDRISMKPSVSLDQKSIRVVVRVGYPTPSGRQIQYDVDFERVENDLKVVRVRDLQGGVIAWDPNIDNYLNRRYGLPDGSTVETVPQSDQIDFLPLPAIRSMAARAIETGNAQKLKEFADLFIERDPTGGEGYGILAALQQVVGNYDEAARTAGKAIDLGATAYFSVLEYGGSFTHDFGTGVLGVSRGKIEYLPTAAAPEEISAASVTILFDQGKWFKTAGPFLKLEIPLQKNKKKTYTFAAYGTVCQGTPQAAGRKDLDVYPNGVFCGAQGTTMANATSIPLLVPRGWYQDLKVIADSIEHAKQGGAAQPKR
jgi:hypothetical protein